jgi:hypothetical protein
VSKLLDRIEAAFAERDRPAPIRVIPLPGDGWVTFFAPAGDRYDAFYLTLPMDVVKNYASAINKFVLSCWGIHKSGGTGQWRERRAREVE